jgi:hypothetical protein
MNKICITSPKARMTIKSQAIARPETSLWSLGFYHNLDGGRTG